MKIGNIIRAACFGLGLSLALGVSFKANAAAVSETKVLSAAEVERILAGPTLADGGCDPIPANASQEYKDCCAKLKACTSTSPEHSTNRCKCLDADDKKDAECQYYINPTTICSPGKGGPPVDPRENPAPGKGPPSHNPQGCPHLVPVNPGDKDDKRKTFSCKPYGTPTTTTSSTTTQSSQ